MALIKAAQLPLQAKEGISFLLLFRPLLLANYLSAPLSISLCFLFIVSPYRKA